MKEKFTYENILFSLREEYLKNREKLEHLKEYVYYDKKRIDNYYFWTCKWNKDMNPELMCTVKSKRQILIHQLKMLSKKIKEDYNGVSYKMLHDNNNNYYIQNSDISIHVFLEKQETFFNQANQCLNYDFVKDIFPLTIPSINDDILIIEPLFIKLIFPNSKFNHSTLTYSVIDDSINVNINGNKMSTELINSILNFEFLKSRFTNYQKRIIKNYSKKNIQIDENINGLLQFKLSINNEHDKLILRLK